MNRFNVKSLMTSELKPIIWTISGADCSGGAGIAADIKTGHVLDIEVCHLITANTIQNAYKLTSVNPVDVSILDQQAEVLLQDKIPSVIKVGLLANAQQVAFVIRTVKQIRLMIPTLKVVWDPVGQASVGGKFSELTATDLAPLLAIIDVVIPNIDEAKMLSAISNEDIKEMASSIASAGVNTVIIKGGHSNGDIIEDYCLHQLNNEMQLEKLDSNFISYGVASSKISTCYSHGGGCSFASAFSAFLAKGYLVRDALVLTKAFINNGLMQRAGFEEYYGAFIQSPLPNVTELFPKVVDITTEKYKSLKPFADLGIKRGHGKKLGLYPVVDSIAWLKTLLPLGLEIIQLRLKGYDEKSLELLIKEAVDICQGSKTRLFINDYWQLAIKYKAYGVHIGQEDLMHADLEKIQKAGLRIGISTHGCYEFLLAQQLKPSYLAIGAIFETKTKNMTSQLQGIDNLKQTLMLATDIPVVAIGGIDHQKAPQVWNTGVDSLAVVSAITEAEDPERSVRAFQTVMFNGDWQI